MPKNIYIYVCFIYFLQTFMIHTHTHTHKLITVIHDGILFLKLILKKQQRNMARYFDLENSKIADYFYSLLSSCYQRRTRPEYITRDILASVKFEKTSDTKIILTCWKSKSFKILHFTSPY